MTQYTVPEAEAFRLLGEKNVNAKQTALPVSHIKSRITFTVMTDDIKLPMYSMPVELVNHIKYIKALFIVTIYKTCCKVISENTLHIFICLLQGD